MKTKRAGPTFRRLALFFVLAAGSATGAQPKGSAEFITYAKETRNRAAVLLVGEVFTAPVAQRLQERWDDEASFFRPKEIVSDAAAAERALERWLNARSWHVVMLGLSPREASIDSDAATLRTLVQRLKERKVAVLWCSRPAPGSRVAVVQANDVARAVMRAEGVEVVDLFGAAPHSPDAWRDEDAGWTEAGVARCAQALTAPFRRALFSRSTPWAELPAREKRDLARLLADPQSLATPMDLAEAPGSTAVVYRAEPEGWQFNLHSFLAHHDGKFWAIWSSGRLDEDSSSQLIRFATSADGLTWSESKVLAADPDGESGPWRWMASGIYADNDRLLALGSLNQGNSPPGGPWAKARLVRHVWTGGGWQEDRVVADNCVVYFPPLRVAGRDFFVWRDSRAHFFTGHSPAGADEWKVTRMPGPLPDYRMSETSAYVDPEGVVHLIIRDQGYTRRLYHAVSYDEGGTWTIPVKTNYPDAVSKNMSGRLSNGWYYLINNPKATGSNPRDPLAITFSRDGWTFSHPLALRKNAPALRHKGGAKGAHSFQYAHAIEHDGKLWVIYATNKEDIEVSAYPIAGFGL